MTAVRKREYLRELKNILSFIALDSLNRARAFKKQLDFRVDGLIHFPKEKKKRGERNRIFSFPSSRWECIL